MLRCMRCLVLSLLLDMDMDSTNFEAVWVEVENRNGKNNLFCCLYRHPSSDLDNFNEYLLEIQLQFSKTSPDSLHSFSNFILFLLNSFSFSFNCVQMCSISSTVILDLCLIKRSMAALKDFSGWYLYCNKISERSWDGSWDCATFKISLHVA